MRAISVSGALTMAEIARETGLPYPTVSRIVATLVSEKYIERELGRKRFRVTGLVQSLAHGFQESGHLVRVGRPHLVSLTNELGWVTLLATPLGGRMIIRDSTHILTSLTFEHYYPGFTFPILDSASGRAFFAYCTPEERQACLRGIAAIEGSEADHAITLAQDDEDFVRIRQRGYATRSRNAFTNPPGKNSTIAVPVIVDGEILATLGLVFFASAMPMEVAEERYAHRLKKVALKMGEELAVQEPQPQLLSSQR